MSDPRTFTVKQCDPSYASKSGASIGSATSARRDFFGALGKIGDVAVLNSVGGGTVARGLRNLASISNSIRTGCGSIPTIVGSTIDSGANWVLETTGIGAAVVPVVRNFNPGIANQAYSQAKNVYEQVKNGNFKNRDIPNVLQDFQNLERLAQGIFTPGAGDVQSALGERCDASAYAVDLIARAPKYKFLFVVQFIPDAAYSELGNSEYGPLEMAFTVKKSTRPTPTFVEEDVNYYNFRTKVITKTTFEDMSMTFHDDNMNFATQFYTAYLRAMAPITGISNPDSNMLEQRGMDFVDNTLKTGQILGQIPGSTYSASHGPLAGDAKQVFREIVLYHLFDGGNRMNVYRFLNPRINTLKLDDLDMSIGNEGSELTINFSYDSVFVDPDVNLETDTRYNLSQTQRGALYPLRYNGAATPAMPSTGGILPGGIPSGAESCDPLSGTNNKSVFSSVANAATTAVADLSSKFSSALSNLPFG